MVVPKVQVVPNFRRPPALRWVLYDRTYVFGGMFLAAVDGTILAIAHPDPPAFTPPTLGTTINRSPISNVVSIIFLVPNTIIIIALKPRRSLGPTVILACSQRPGNNLSPMGTTASTVGNNRYVRGFRPFGRRASRVLTYAPLAYGVKAWHPRKTRLAAGCRWWRCCWLFVCSQVGKGGGGDLPTPVR